MNDRLMIAAGVLPAVVRVLFGGVTIKNTSLNGEELAAVQALAYADALLAAANEKLSESARLATESAQLADGLARDLAAANERAGRLEAALRDAIGHVAGSHIGHYGDHRAYCDITVRPERLTAWVEALEVPDAL